MVKIRSLEGNGAEKHSMLKYEPYLNIMQYPQYQGIADNYYRLRCKIGLLKY